MPSATILITDDDPVTLQLLGGSLRREGYRVLTALDAMQCLMAAHRGKPDVILLDVMLPGGGGLDALRKLKTNSLTQPIPVVGISASSDAGLSERILGLGAEDFLPKPVDLARLSDVLQRLLGR